MVEERIRVQVATCDAQRRTVPGAWRVAAFARLLCASIFSSAGGAQAQGFQPFVAPSQVTPRTFVPPPAAAARAFEISAAAGLAAPRGAEQFSLLVGRVELEGGFPELAADNAALAERLTGKRVSVADIFAAAADLERAYAAAGYALARLAAPPQKLVDGGPVRLVVIDGFIEDVRVDGAPERVRDAIRARAAVLVGRKRVTSGEIERAVLLAGDLAGLRLRSALARGRQTGGSTLTLEGEQRLVTGSIGLDNRLPASLGGQQGNSSLSINSALGRGEQFYASVGSSFFDAAGGAPFVTAPLHVLGVGAIAPVGVDGLTVNPEYTRSRAVRVETLQTPRTEAAFERYALRGSYPAIRARAQTLFARAELDYIFQHIAAPLFQTNLTADRYRAARFDLDWQAHAPWDQPYRIDLQLSKGLGGRNGADAAWSGIPLSKQGASPWFTKLMARGWVSQALPNQLQLTVIGMAQTSFGAPLLLPEQLPLEGPEALGGLSPGLVMVDTGATLRGEISRAFAPAASEYGALSVAPYVFGAGGLGRIYEPTALEKSTLHAACFGVGARTGYALNDGFGAITFGIELGQQYSNIPGRGESRRVNAYGGLRF